jgi:hypothetical protein
MLRICHRSRLTFIHSDFNCREVIESAFDAAVRKNADETGVTVEGHAPRSRPQNVRGSAPHIHQLITMLASSLPSITRANNLEFQVSVESEQDDAWQ